MKMVPVRTFELGPQRRKCAPAPSSAPAIGVNGSF